MDETFVFPAAASLKDEANKLYTQRQYAQAVELWKKALTIALKQSMKGVTQELIDLQTNLRLNIAQGLIMEEDFVLAKENLLIVLERFPTNKKALYRLAVVYRGLQDFEKSIGIAKRGIELHDDDTFRILYNEIVTEEGRARAEARSKAPILSLGKYADDRSDQQMLDEGCITFASEPTTTDIIQSCDKIFEWKCKLLPSDSPSKEEQIRQVDADVDDWTTGNRWLSPYTMERLRTDRTVLNVSLPLSILYGLDILLRPSEIHKCSSIVDDLTANHHIILPPLDDLIAPEERASSQSLPAVADCANLITALGGRGNNLRPFNIHVLNSRGDDEVEVHWSSLLERLPKISRLQLILIGFNRPDDPYARSLGAQDYFSQTLTKCVASENRKVACRLFKGTYTDFLNSPAVKKASRSETDILTDPDHAFHPNFVVIPQCNLSRHFKEFVPIISRLLLSDVWVFFLGHSCCELPSHEALQLPAVLRALKAKFMTDLYWNPFMIPVKPDEDFPEMSIRTKDGNSIENYRGLSAKYAVGLWVKGGFDLDLLRRLVESPDEVRIFQDQLRDGGADVDVEADALQKLMSSEEYVTKAKELLEEQSIAVEKRTAELTESLRAKLSGADMASTQAPTSPKCQDL